MRQNNIFEVSIKGEPNDICTCIYKERCQIFNFRLVSSLNGKGKLLLPALCGIHCKSYRSLNKGKRSAVCGNREDVFCPDVWWQCV